MAFPTNPSPGDSYTDEYGTVWVYAGAVNGWYRQTVITPNDTSYTAAISGPAGSNTQVLNIASSASSGDGAQIRFTQNFGRVGRLYLTSEAGNGSGAMTLESPSTRDIIFRDQSSERARIDSSGRLLVGTSSGNGLFNGGTQNPQFQIEGTIGNTILASLTANRNDAAGPTFYLAHSRGTAAGGTTVLQSGDQCGILAFAGTDGTDYVTAATITAQVDGTPGADDMPGRLVFSTTADGASSPTERMRISSAGNTTLTSTSVTSATLIVKSNGASNFQRGIVINFDGRTPNDNQSYFWAASDTTNTKGIFYSNGGLANYSANNVNLCDVREKKNIEALESTWGCLKNWELKKFHYNEDNDADDKRYGVIAQQVAPHCPEVISDWVKQRAQDAVLDDEGNVVTPAKEEVVRMAVKEQQMMWMAIKALQEAQVRIETLEAEVAALKG